MMVTPAKAKNRASALLSLNRSARAIRSHRFSANQIVPRPRRLSYRLMTRARFLDPLPLTSITPLCHLKVITELICMPMPCDRVPRRAHFLWNFARVKTSVCCLSDASVTHAGSTIDSGVGRPDDGRLPTCYRLRCPLFVLFELAPSTGRDETLFRFFNVGRRTKQLLHTCNCLEQRSCARSSDAVTAASAPAITSSTRGLAKTCRESPDLAAR